MSTPIDFLLVPEAAETYVDHLPIVWRGDLDETPLPNFYGAASVGGLWSGSDSDLSTLYYLVTQKGITRWLVVMVDARSSFDVRWIADRLSSGLHVSFHLNPDEAPAVSAVG